MEKLPDNKYLKFNPNTLEEVRQLYDLDNPGAMSKAVDELEDWVKKQQHFVKHDFSRGYLERIIIGTKGSLTRAQEKLDKTCTFKTLLPKYFGRCDIKSLNIYPNLYITVSAKLTKDNCRVVTITDTHTKYLKSVVLEATRAFFTVLEYLLANDYSSGLILLFDYRKVNLTEIIKKLNLIELHQMQSIFTKAYSIRLKGIHLITPSTLINSLVAILKKILSKKLRERIFTHKTMEDMHQYIPKEILPEEFGGDEECIDKLKTIWMNLLCSEEHQNYLQELAEARTDESKRQTAAFNDDYIGMPGSFMNLNVD